MQIRKISDAEKGKTRKLYEEIFSEDSVSFVDYYYTEKTKDNTIYVVEEDGAVRAMLHLNPYTLMVNGKEEPSHYIVAVATEKEYRKRGYMARQESPSHSLCRRRRRSIFPTVFLPCMSRSSAVLRGREIFLKNGAQRGLPRETVPG